MFSYNFFLSVTFPKTMANVKIGKEHFNVFDLALMTAERGRCVEWLREIGLLARVRLPHLPKPYDRGGQCQDYRRHSLVVQPQDLPHSSDKMMGEEGVQLLDLEEGRPS